ncbi:hypothetical protein [Dyadobacter sp. 32]|uniref:hypothetical protein n=1 Tax=Dyadobacter sp. 32 TaxID=538966 RepID=UPI0039C6C2E7
MILLLFIIKCLKAFGWTIALILTGTVFSIVVPIGMMVSFIKHVALVSHGE